MPDPIVLQPGDQQKIISQPQQGSEWNVQVNGNRTYLSHNNSAVVREGEAAAAGDRAKLRNLRGKSIYAKVPATATDNAQIEVSRAGFDLIFQPRSIVGAVDTGEGDKDAPAASDDYDEVTGSAVDIGSGGSTSEVLVPPGRSDQVMLRVEGTAAFDVTVTWNNTSETYASNAGNIVNEVLPVYYINDDIDVDVTDTSGGANTVDYDMVVV